MFSLFLTLESNSVNKMLLVILSTNLCLGIIPRYKNFKFIYFIYEIIIDIRLSRCAL